MPVHTLSDTLGNSSGKITYTCVKGDKYSFGYLDLEAMSKFESAIFEKDICALKRLKDTLDSKEYEELQAKIMKNWFEGEYVFGGKRSMSELSNLWGVSNVLSIVSGVTPVQANDLIQNNSDLKDVVKLIIEKSFPLTKKKQTDM